MRDDTSIPTEQSSETKRSHPAWRTGIYTGALLIVTMLGALVAANRMPTLERYALERNAIFYTLFVLLMLVPVVRFFNRPMEMLTASAMIGWVLFVAAYDLAGLFFRNLFEVLRTPFQALVEGAVVYGVFAGGSWVAGMVFHARRHPILPGRRRAGSETATSPMKLCRFEPIESAKQHPGRTVRETMVESRAGIVDDGTIREISGEIWGDRRLTGREWR